MIWIYLQLLKGQGLIEIYVIGEAVYFEVQQPSLGARVHGLQLLLLRRVFPLQLDLHLDFVEYAINYLAQSWILFALRPPLLGQPVM